jgi:phosphoribosylformylglycinamidine synthase
MHRVEVSLKGYLPDIRGQGLVRDIADLGITTVSDARVIDIYWLDAELKTPELNLICCQLLTDPVIQDYHCDDECPNKAPTGGHTIEVAYNIGVADPVADTILKAVADLGINGVQAAKTTRRYIIIGQVNEEEQKLISSRLLINPIIQHEVTGEPVVFPKNPEYNFRLKHFSIIDADGKYISELATQFGFNKNEMTAITAHFKKEGRNPTDAELETLAQTWSEHCVHKTFKAKINYNGQLIDNLMKSTIFKATRELNKPWCLSVFEDNAGVIDFDGEWALCFKVETHNHPSAVEPYGGAATGIGGVIRDIMGTGLSARPILNTDVFCFAEPDFPYEKLPPGVLHPRRIFKGVRAGVADYANRLGIPTPNGAVLFDKRYLGNPLVYCGTVGIMPTECARMGKQQKGDLVVLIGGRTGRDGIHGVTFASEKLTDRSTDVSYSSVQIGNPIVEKKMIDAILQARDKKLFKRITDCGGGGLSSAIGEMAENTGVNVYLDRVPLKYAGLSHDEIWISESQERMILAVPPECVDELLELMTYEDVEASIIGEFTDNRRLRLFYEDNPVGDLDMTFLHSGLPQRELNATWSPPQHEEPNFKPPSDLGADLKAILNAWNVCSKEWVIRQYDHEVQGSSVLKPLVGRDSDGPGDAAIIRPRLDSNMGVIVSNGINPCYGDIDPYWMTAAAIDEALRQIIAVGGDLEKVALLDNFSWGNVNHHEGLGALVRAAQACHDMSVAFETPFISGKDSLNNEFNFEGKTISIPHTLLISAMAVMEDTSKAVSMDFKNIGNLIYIVGSTYNELGGSAYFRARGFIGNDIPRVKPQEAKRLMEALSRATRQKLVRACHDLSEGGLGTALAEMAFAGRLGVNASVKDIPLGEVIERDDYILFSESNSRFLVEVSPDNKRGFEMIMASSPFAVIGNVSDSGRVIIEGNKGKVIDEPIEILKEVWQKPLKW